MEPSKGATILGTRYVGPVEAAIIERTSMVPNSDVSDNPKLVFYTPEPPVRSASQARAMYQLPFTPTHVVELDTSEVHNTYGGNVEGGSGIELATADEIPAIKLTTLDK